MARYVLLEKDISVEEVPSLAIEIVASLRAHVTPRACVLTLQGPLGAGKTTLTQALASKLGISDPVTSPTFVIQKRYTTNAPDFHSLVHIDAYRTAESNELRVLGFEMLVKEPGVLVVIEWPERIEDLLPLEYFEISLQHVSETKRAVRFSLINT